MKFQTVIWTDTQHSQAAFE